MSEMPKILERNQSSENSIPNPDDIGLDVFTREVVRNSQLVFGESGVIEPGQVESYGLRLAKEMERNPEAIRQRQEVFEYLMENSDLTDFILETELPELNGGTGGKHWNWSFHNTKRAAESYLGLVEGISQRIEESEAPEVIEDYSREIDDFMESEEYKSFRQMFNDVKSPTKTEVEISLPMEHDRMDDNWICNGKVRFQSEMESGRVGRSSDRRQRRGLNTRKWDFDFPSDSLINDLVEEVEQKSGVKASFWEAPVDIKMELDEENETLEAKAEIEKKGIKAYASRLVGGDRETVEVDLDLSYDDIEWEGGHKMERAIRKAKHNELNRELERKYEDALTRDGDAIAELKYLAAAANYMNQIAEEVPITTPSISQDRTSIEGLHDPNLVGSDEVEEVVPNDVEYNEENQVFLVTGPNNGGKTTYMNAIGMAQAMYQLGMPVPAEEAEMTPKDGVFSHYIRESDIERDGSRFKNELERLRELFGEVTPETMVLMDEPFSGTSPSAGTRQLHETLELLGELGATTYASTHFHGVELDGETIPEKIEKSPYGQNLHVSTEGDLEFTYRIQEGYSTKSEGEAVAKDMEADLNGLTSLLEEREEVPL